jgi:hypothetical protein
METPLSSTTNFVFKSRLNKLNRFYVYGSKNRSVASVKELFYSRTRKVKKAIYMRHLNPKSVEAKKKENTFLKGQRQYSSDNFHYFNLNFKIKFLNKL